ncbi:hypothetical protein OU995_06775 [Roseateles sp. SL47]|uniref:ArnT family glycosyltransferase n=1 Tax=Roseateles sp. SL47 TaxID=2995138 RepID=UPI00226D6DE0|nr:hypothetical protein [Roseateles sp. SL47]WAC74417.1 hypothetical protein OU995_06775 [Roseateles sp. SL47]
MAGLLTALLLWRCWVAATLPITGDEAYFIGWGRHPDWGFYDHPPMVGWWLAAQLTLGDHPLWLRLSAVLLPFVLSLMLLVAGRRADASSVGRSSADAAGGTCYQAAALLVPLLPSNVWNVLITTDTPLIYFSVLSGLAWLRVRAGGGHLSLALAAVGLAGAVLSKYFAALLWLAYVVDTLTTQGRKPWRALAAVSLACVPPLLLMGWWNSQHCWPNLMFNFINRNADIGPGWQHPVAYVGVLLYSLTPLAVAPLLPRVAPRPGPQAPRTLQVLAVVPLAAFGLLSLVKPVGLHWVLAFLPLALLALLQHGRPAFRTWRFFLAGLAMAHGVVVSLVLLMPMSAWRELAQFPSLALYLDTPPLAQALSRLGPTATLATLSYAQSATLAYHTHRPVIVFGTGSFHARQDDLDTDFRRLAGQDLLILSKPGRPQDLAPLSPYFDNIHMESITHQGLQYPVLRGQGFRYERYRQEVLSQVLTRFYQLPGLLRHGVCPVSERYAR